MSTEISTASTVDHKINPLPRNLGLALAVIAVAQLMVVLDATIVNIALPSIQKALQFSATGLEWVINAYALTFGGLLLLGGRAGDLFGRRRMFTAGIVVFTLGSLAGGFATSATWLIIARAAQGIGAAIVAPTALSLIADTFSEGPDRNRALGVYGAVAGAGGALGLLLGGVLTNFASWRWVLFVNVPIGIVLAIVAPRVLASSHRRPGRLDLPGALTVTGGMVSLVYGLSHAATYGWTDMVTLMALGLAVLLLLVFVTIESRSRHALMPFTIFAQRNRDGAYMLSLVIGVAVFGVFFFLTQFVQNILGFSPLVAGVAFLPLTAAIIITAQIVARLVGRFGPRPFITIGPLLVATGLFWLSQINDQTSYLTGLVGPMLLIAVGMGNIFVPLTLMAVAGTTSEESGLASALLNVGQQIGGSIGIALLGTIAATATKNQLAGVIPTHAALNHALAAGYGSAFLVAVGIALLGFVTAVLVFRGTRSPQTAARLAEETAA
ncbi:MAG TPA: MFS transporter [Candidatus Dormibacteraeota bacterium]|nr:MFS transporter [Candidatus Dormibacteraeota bacterium]